MNPEKGKYVIVLGFSVTALGTLRCVQSLKKEGYTIILAGTEGKLTIALHSRIPDRKFVFRNGLTEGLLEIHREFSGKPILLLTQDKDAVEISASREKLEAYYDFQFPSKDLLEVLMEKIKFTEFAIQKDLPLPKTYFIENESGLLNFSDPASYPLIVKPYLLHASKVYSPGDMKALIAKLEPINYKSLIVQDYIEGEDDSIVFCFLLFNRDGKLVHRMVARKLRQWPISYGTTSLAETEAIPELENDLQAFVQSVIMRGFCSIEFKYDKTRKRFYIMEPTIGRFNQQIVLTKKAGVNFPLAMVRMLNGEALEVLPQRNGVRWIYESNDFFSYLNSRTSYGYWKNFLKPHINVLFAMNDPAPFFFEWYSIFRNKLMKNRKHV